MSDKIKFPALPPRDHAFTDPEGDRPDIDLWRIEKMSAYGQQCYQQALEDAARMLMAEHKRRWHNDNHALFFAHKVRALGEKK